MNEVNGITPSHSQHPVGSSTQLMTEPQTQNKRIQKVSLEQLKKMFQNKIEHEAFIKRDKKSFTILFTGDTHSNLEPSLASFVSNKPLGGVIRRIQYVEQLRKESSQPILVLDAGDFLQGTAYFEQFEGSAEIKFMNHAGYDVITVGNHDFDMGWPHLTQLLKNGKFDAICSNIYPEGSTKTCLAPYTLVEIEGQHVAIVGVMGMDSWQSIRPYHRKGLEIKDPMETLNQLLPEIRPYVDLVILLSHSGVKDDRVLATHPLVDIVLGGHSHTWMTEQELVKTKPGLYEKITPVFHSFRNGMLVGRMDVMFKDGKFLNTESSIQYLDEQFDPQYEAASDTLKVALNVFKDYQQQMEIFKTPLGECVETLPSKDKGLGVVDIGHVIANTLRECGQASIGVIPSGAIKVGIEKGPFTLGVLHRVLAHSEALWVLNIKGSLLLSLMKQGEERWGKQRCFQYVGISIHKSGTEITSLTIDGKTMDKNSFYSIAGPSFFFEREFMDQQKNILPEFLEEIKSVEVRAPDLRIPFAEMVRAKGLGKWVSGLQKG